MKTAHASLDAGRLALDRGDYAAALREFLPLARKGNASAQYYVGLMCHEGKGVPEDNAAAFSWSLASAERGNADAEALLGLLYAQGKGVPRDDAEAARWFHRAGMRGNPAGQSKMGLCCMRGLGVPRDYKAAYMWFDLAATHSTGHDEKCNRDLRDTFAAMHLTPAQIADAQKAAREWKPRKPALLKRLHVA